MNASKMNHDDMDQLKPYDEVACGQIPRRALRRDRYLGGRRGMNIRSRVTVSVLGLLTLLLIGACGTSSDEEVAKGTGSQSEAGGSQAAQTGVQQGGAEPKSTPRPAIKAPLATVPLSEGQIAAADAAAHIGEETKVCGFVAEARYEKDLDGRPTFLWFDQPPPNHPFQVLIPGNRRTRWPQTPER